MTWEEKHAHLVARLVHRANAQKAAQAAAVRDARRAIAIAKARNGVAA